MPSTTSKTKGDTPEELLSLKSLKEKSVPETASEAFNVLLSACGDYNRYQWQMVAICGFCCFFTALHNLAAVFLAYSPDHQCQVPYLQGQNNSAIEHALNYTVPWVRGKDGRLQPSKCNYYTYDVNSNWSEILSQWKNGSFPVVSEPEIRDTEKCQSWIYDDTYFQSTVVTEWDLVCERKWLMSTTQSSYMLGIMTGAVVFSGLSDRFGRRPSSVTCTIIFFCCSVAASFSNSFTTFLVLRFFVAAASQGMTLVNFTSGVLGNGVMEIVGKKGRSVMGNLYHLFFDIGLLALCLCSYLISDWRKLQLTIAIPTGILMIYYWILPESPRWLLSQGREKEGIEALKKIAKTNGLEFPKEQQLRPLLNVILKEAHLNPNLSKMEKIKSTFNMVLILVRTPNMRRRSLIMFYAWFVVSMSYYGIIFNSSNINASPFISMALLGCIQPVALISVILALFKFGRRPILCVGYIIGGLACIAIIFVPIERTALNLTLSTIGVFMVTISFLMVFIYSAELVPTGVRNIAIGIASLFARIGSGAAPYIVDLLGDLYYAIPSTIFGILSFIAGLLALLLPETGDKNLPESVEEIEKMPR